MLLIFDWDGTLSDSTSRIVSCLQQAAVSAGVQVLSDDAIRNIIGLGLPEAMECLYPDLSADKKECVRQEYVRHFLLVDHEPSPFYPGVIEGLTRLRQKDFRMAVATGKSRRGLDRVLGRLKMQHFFDGTRCADETASKPNPLMLNELLAEFDLLPEKAIMVGDTEYDMDMALQAGVHRVAVSYGAHHIDRLHPYQPVLSVDHFPNFVEWVVSSYSV